MLLGLFLILLSGFLLCYNIWDDYRAKISCSQIIEKFPSEGQQAYGNVGDGGVMGLPFYVTNPDMEMPVVMIDGHQYIGKICIPYLELLLSVVSECSDANLKLAPCRYAGSAYQNNLVTAGHNYRSHFGTLRKLRYGDSVFFTNTEGNVFEYEVAEIEQLASTSVEAMKVSQWALTLFTCTVDGSNRVAVRCQQVA